MDAGTPPGRRLVPALALLAVGAMAAFAPTADAQIRGEQSADRWVTIAARECDRYTDIRANLAQ